MTDRTVIEQARSKIDNETYDELTIDDMGNERWTEQYLKTFDSCFDTKVWPPFPKVERKMKFNTNLYFF